MMAHSQAVADRFWSKVDVRSADECWPWKAAVRNRRSNYQYGAFWLDGRHRPASRIALELRLGFVVGEHFEACHSCDNPPCCNPQHLFVETPGQNAQDKVNKMRHVHGASVHTNVLTEEQVRELMTLKPAIRARHGERQQIANRFGIKPSLVSEIWQGRSWRHL